MSGRRGTAPACPANEIEAMFSLRIAALQGLTFSASIGVAHFAAGESPAGLIARADKALYLAKANGRNCVYSADWRRVVIRSAKQSCIFA